jgi:hypothetical protein
MTSARLAALATILAAPLALAGCVSAKAAVARAEFALESEYRLRDSVEQSRAVAKHWMELAARNEVARINSQLDRANNFAEARLATDPLAALRNVAEATHAYHAAMREAEGRIASEHAKIDSLFAEQVAISRGFRLVSDMADRELTVPAETAKLAASESLVVGAELWRQWQLANPPSLPDASDVKPPNETEYGGGTYYIDSDGNTVYTP